MKLTDEMQSELNQIFGGLWASRYGVKGSWPSDAFRYHPTYIKRGALLFVGETRFDTLWVIVPGDAKVTPNYGDSRCHCSTMPHIEGKLIEIGRHDDHPAWALLSEEIPKMEQELRDSIEKARAATEQERISKEQLRQRKLDEAADSLRCL
jgi:hypothetical protein